MSANYWTRCTGWLLIAVATCAVVNCAFVQFVMSTGESRASAEESTGLLLTPRLRAVPGVDSIRPMAAAYVRQQQSGDMYWVFLAKGVKFQYPPSSLLVMKLLPQPIVVPVPPAFAALQAAPSLFAILMTIACGALLWLKLMLARRNTPSKWRIPSAAVSMCLIGILGVTYYPLTKGHNLGQIQVYIGALSALALLLQELDFTGLSGVCLGLCCLIKPQSAVLLLWALMRRQTRFVLGFGIVVAVGLWLSVREFGLNNHLQYLEVLQHMSRHGEAYGANQSVNGLLNRWFGNGNAIKFQSHAFAPYHPIVYAATVASSVLLLALALFVPAARSQRGGSLDLAVVMCAATMASPITWEHHYGAFFPIFLLALVAALTAPRLGLFVLASYTLVANELLRPKLVFADHWTGIFGSHIFFGALLLFGFLLSVRFRGTEPLRVASRTKSLRALLFG